jgi:adenylate cyclase
MRRAGAEAHERTRVRAGVPAYRRTVTARTGVPAHRRTAIAWRALFLSVCASVASVRLCAQCPDGTPPPCGRAATRPAAVRAPSPNSVAVLAFENLSRDTADAFLAHGLADAVTSSLSGIERLDIRSASATRYYQDRFGRDLRGLARALAVRYLIEGMVVSGPDRIAVTVGIVEAATLARRGSWRLVRPRSDLVQLLDVVADSLATEIAGRLDPTERAALVARRTDNAGAMEALMRGDALEGTFNPGLWERMLNEYGAAVRLDSNWARAHARLASGYARCVEFALACRGLGQDSLLALSGREASLALRLDSASSEAWLARANYLENQPAYPLEVAALGHAYERAVALDPRDGDAVRQYGDFLRNWRRQDDAAIAAFRRALAANPTDATAYSQLARTARYQGRLRDAVTLADSGLAITPAHVPALQELTSALAALGARSRLEQTLRSAPAGSLAASWIAAVRALAQAASGDSAAATLLLNDLAATPLVLPPVIDALCRLGRADDAVSILTAHRASDRWLTGQATGTYRSAWLLDRWILCPEVKNDPRYQAWLERDRRVWAP